MSKGSRWLIAASLVLSGVLLAACEAEPIVDEDLPDSRPWFSVEAVRFLDGGLVVVEGQVLDAILASGEWRSDAASTSPFPDHIAYGLWPNPTEVGAAETVDVNAAGEFVLTHDFGRGVEVREGWHVLQFDKADWGSQVLWLNIERKEWREARP